MITANQVKDGMTRNGIITVDHHSCGFCDYMTKFVREGDELFFDPGCDCVPYIKNLEPREFQDAADWVNMQSDPDIKSKLAAKFGVVVGEEGS